MKKKILLFLVGFVIAVEAGRERQQEESRAPEQPSDECMAQVPGAEPNPLVNDPSCDPSLAQWSPPEPLMQCQERNNPPAKEQGAQKLSAWEKQMLRKAELASQKNPIHCLKKEPIVTEATAQGIENLELLMQDLAKKKVDFNVSEGSYDYPKMEGSSIENQENRAGKVGYPDLVENKEAIEAIANLPSRAGDVSEGSYDYPKIEDSSIENQENRAEKSAEESQKIIDEAVQQVSGPAQKSFVRKTLETALIGGSLTFVAYQVYQGNIVTPEVMQAISQGALQLWTHIAKAGLAVGSTTFHALGSLLLPQDAAWAKFIFEKMGGYGVAFATSVWLPYQGAKYAWNKGKKTIGNVMGNLWNTGSGWAGNAAGYGIGKAKYWFGWPQGEGMNG